MIKYLDTTSYSHTAGPRKLELGACSTAISRRGPVTGWAPKQGRGWQDARPAATSPLGLPWKAWFRSTDVKAHNCPDGATSSWGRDDGEHVNRHPSCRHPSEKAGGRPTQRGTALRVCKHVQGGRTNTAEKTRNRSENRIQRKKMV